jgi:citrate lyase subunit beta/citryl-CoA lyase
VTKPYDGPWVIRTLLFVPSHVEKMLQKGPTSDADCVVLDLEDAVPADKKVYARERIRTVLEEGLYSRKTVFVRVNPIDSGMTLHDLRAVACAELNGFVYPMACSGDDIRAFAAQCRLMESELGLDEGHFSLIPLIETPDSVLNVREIAFASSRNVGLLFGCEDFLAEMEARHTENDAALHTPRAMVALAARAAGIEPIDTPYVRVHDLDGLRGFAGRARDVGMAGMLVMTPRQIGVAHEIYTPSDDEVRYAREVVKAAEEAQAEGRSIVVVEGKFVSPPTLKAARRVIRRADAIDALASFGRRS